MLSRFISFLRPRCLITFDHDVCKKILSKVQSEPAKRRLIVLFLNYACRQITFLFRTKWDPASSVACMSFTILEENKKIVRPGGEIM